MHGLTRKTRARVSRKVTEVAITGEGLDGLVDTSATLLTASQPGSCSSGQLEAAKRLGETSASLCSHLISWICIDLKQKMTVKASLSHRAVFLQKRERERDPS